MDMSPADYAALNGNDGFGVGGSWLAWILIFALFGGGFGFGNRGNAVTEADLCTSQNFNNLQNAVGRISDNQATIARQTDNAIATIGYQNLQNLSTMQQELSTCCCNIERNIDGVNYNVASQAAAINANTTAQVQKVLDAICGNRMADMQNQINQLQLQAALCGIPRTNPYGYGIYAYPACAGVAGCGTNI